MNVDKRADAKGEAQRTHPGAAPEASAGGRGKETVCFVFPQVGALGLYRTESPRRAGLELVGGARATGKPHAVWPSGCPRAARCADVRSWAEAVGSARGHLAPRGQELLSL